jgi:small subunit ribosomal protein S16
MGSAAGSPPGAAAARKRICWEKTIPVAVKIKLKRLGKIRAPYYRIVVADSRTKRDGRAIEEIGKYHPKAEPSLIEVDSDRAQHWLSVGAQPTDPVRKLFEITGDWQKFKGLPGTEGTLKTAAPKEDRKETFAAAVKETLGDAAAAPKGRARSGAGRDTESAARTGAGRDTESSARGGRASAAAGKTDKPARAKAGEGGEEAKASADDAKAKAKAGDARAADAKAGGARGADAKAGGARGGDAKAGGARGGDAKAGGARGGTAKGAAKAADAAEAPADAAEAPADAADAPAEAPPAAETAGSESASGD